MKVAASIIIVILFLGCLWNEENKEDSSVNESEDDEFIKEYLTKELSVNNQTKNVATTSTTTSSSTTSTKPSTTTIYGFNVTDDVIEAFRGHHNPPTTSTSTTTSSTTSTTTAPCMLHCSEIRYPSPDNCKMGCCYTTGDRCEYSPGNLKAGGGPKCRCS
ncbi:MAG: hypothetical protein KKD39_08175 [Candidatus Altiarchaeota archaeon]|nr:hypothetical protein [Candidatus Altiarchaeota archaeon]